jgi:hypothetical protein
MTPPPPVPFLSYAAKLAPRRAPQSASLRKSGWHSMLLAMLLAMTLVALLFGEIPFVGLQAAASDTLLVGGVGAADVVANLHVPTCGVRLPQGLLETPFFSGGLAGVVFSLRLAPQCPLSNKTNPPTEGEYAFLRTLLRTLSPLCRIACG